MSVTLVELHRAAFAARAEEVLDVYAEAMEVPRSAARGRRSILDTHLERDGLAAVGALDEHGTLLGIAYGYRGAPGQWWHDQVRAALYAAANAMLMRSIAWSSLKAWGMRLMKTKGRRRAIVAVARKLAVVLHRMWADGTEFRHGSEAAA